MSKVRALVILAALWAAPAVSEPSPQDIQFKISFAANKSFFNVGEPLEIEISYSTQVEKKYRGSWSTPRPGLVSVIPKLSPTEGTIDLASLVDYRPVAGSILSSIGFLGSEVVTQRLDLGDWYRFQEPGHYSVSVQSNEVSMAKRAEDGGGWEFLSLESSTLEFDVVADPAWIASQVGEITRALKDGDETERYRALHRLIVLDTPQSVQKLGQLYFSESELTEGERGRAYHGLLESSQIEVIIPLAEAALADPGIEPREGMADLLAALQVRKELGVLPPPPSDPAGQSEWKERSEARTAVFQKYLAKANERVNQTITHRAGPERAAATYLVWFTAERENSFKPVAPETISRLRDAVLAAAPELAPGDRIQLLTTLWSSEPHWRLKPTVLSLVENRGKADNFSLDEAYRFWCEGWPQECGATILSEAIRPGTATSKNAVFLMAESEHPELDDILKARLKDPGMMQDSWESQRVAAIILRAGSRKLQPSVDEFLDKYVAQPRYGCEIEGYLIGYLFRSAVADATKRFTEETGSDHPCTSQLLRTLDTVRYSDELIPLAVKALDAGDLASAGMAATFLGLRGPATVEAALWQRLETLRERWRERAAELRGADTGILYGGVPERGAQLERGRTVQLEQSLVSALVRGASWKLTPGEQDRLREGCLTETCRDVAEGKMSFGF
jgi:hypothetical protein